MQLNENLKNLIWTEKYRPQKIDDCILPEDIKKTFKDFVKKNDVPNLLLYGGPGMGKSTLAQAILREMGVDTYVINGSMNGNIDTLRNEIKDFASSVSLFGSGRKYILIEESDYLNPNSTQPALRNFMEEYTKNCGFILTCNYKNKMIEPLHSRLVGIDFNFDAKTAAKLKIQFFSRLKFILENENVEYDKNVLVELIQKYFPDMRKAINELQRYSSSGKINSGILINALDENFDQLVTILKNKNFTEMRKWVAENSHLDVNAIVRKIYDKGHEFLKPVSLAEIIIKSNEYSFKSAFVVDQEINTASFLTEFMMMAEYV